MYKELLVATTGEGDDAAALRQACVLAQAGDGHVAALVQISVPVLGSAASGAFSAQALTALVDGARLRAEADCDRWREIIRRAGVMGEVRLSDDVLANPPMTAAVHARYVDLALVGLGAQGTLPPGVGAQVWSILSGSGRPVMVVPSGWKEAPCSRVVVCWRPSVNAVRAVHDAMPLLSRAQSIHVVCVDPGRGADSHGADPGVDLARHLARHGLAVTVHVESSSGDEPGEVLSRRARELGADLLVAGGYSHSRFLETLLGGTTTYFLRNTAVPVLFSH